jgi:indole-3-glycerol phosphate synthase
VNVLDQILASTREDLEARRREAPLSDLIASGDAAPRPPAHAFRDALTAPGMSVIAEHKRRSPSAGAIRSGSSVAEIAVAYERGGAAAMSVLTEERHFGGSLADLRAARAACSLPLLRKDFIVDSYQLHEAVLGGAAAVLLIVAALDDAELRELNAAALELGLDVLVEVHDASELERAAALGAVLIGVNNRDLRDFSVELERTFELLGAMPAGAIVVSESGIRDASDLARLGDAGVHAVLIGEGLMRSTDPAAALAAMLAG